LLSSGYIAGAAITGVLLAIVALPAGGAYLRLLDVPGQLQQHLPVALARFLSLVGGDESASPGWSNLWGLLFFAALATFLLRTGIRGRNAASNDPAR
jgi:hypothetical protein